MSLSAWQMVVHLAYYNMCMGMCGTIFFASANIETVHLSNKQIRNTHEMKKQQFRLIAIVSDEYECHSSVQIIILN